MSSSQVCDLPALFVVYKLALSAFARRASVRLLSSTASCSLRIRASSFFRFFSSAFSAFVDTFSAFVNSGVLSDVLDLFPNGQPIPPPGLIDVNDECDGDEGVDGGRNVVAEVGVVEKSVRVGDVRRTLVTVAVGECVSER